MKQHEIEQRRANELRNINDNLKEEQFSRILSDVKSCFDKGKTLIEADLVNMERVVKKVKKSKRKLKAQRIAEFSKKEFEFQDALSSSGESLGSINDDTLPKCHLGLAGVLIKENGEPMELTGTPKWDQEYDEDNSIVLFNCNYRMIQSLESLPMSIHCI